MLLCAFLRSLPLRECGLKLTHLCIKLRKLKVTPLAGVWIEISMPTQDDTKDTVTPLAGVWIEINIKSERRYTNGSHSPCGSVD